MFNKEYDVVVVGGGHAGSEAAAAAARRGARTLLVTMNLQNIAQMSCNPAMGGIAKGQIVREIDALGGFSGRVSDLSAVQYKMLNISKGPAMWSPRTQNDRYLFSTYWREILEGISGLHFYQDMVTELVVENNRLKGVKTAIGSLIRAKSVVLTNGTFLNGLIHIGERTMGGGRSGERASKGLTECLQELGFLSGRMKTGTPPRVDGRSLNYEVMKKQPGDLKPGKFSYWNATKPLDRQLDCHSTHTNREVHDLLRSGFDRSPMFNGRIKSIGPRYCPSIEDKIDRFADKEQHQIFVEPEGWNTVEVYVNGFSTSLPEDVQFKALKKVLGFENVRFFRPGYAIEYDYFPPMQLRHSLETKLVQGLFFAGQINGTTGYEEAAAQGLMAGINAAGWVMEKEAVVLKRSEAYIGVLIDDLITKGTEEPYRMFTSRAEYRTLLRQDNADLRLSFLGHGLKLIGDDQLKIVESKKQQTDTLVYELHNLSLRPEDLNEVLIKWNSKPVKHGLKASKILARPEMSLQKLEELETVKLSLEIGGYNTAVKEQAEIGIKYAGYIKKEEQNADKLQRLEEIAIPENFDFNKLQSISTEARLKLSNARPGNLYQASRISGVSPSDLNVLLVYMGR